MPTPAPPPILHTLAERIDASCTGPLNLVLIDGVPASGKSSLALELRRHLIDRGRPCEVVANDWFIDRAIRSPAAIALGLLIALTPIGVDRAERALLARFLDGDRLGHFYKELGRARTTLRSDAAVTIQPRGAFWNLRHPPAWEATEAAHGLTLTPGAVVLIEGTLTRAVYLDRFPDARTIFVHVPAEVARRRFLARNRKPDAQRNLAFTALALNGLAFRLAARMLGRYRAAYDLEVDLTHFHAPAMRERLDGRTPSRQPPSEPVTS